MVRILYCKLHRMPMIKKGSAPGKPPPGGGREGKVICNKDEKLSKLREQRK